MGLIHKMDRGVELRMNKYLRRLIETTLPSTIGYGSVVLITTHFIGLSWGIMSIIIFAAIDVMMGRE